MHNVVFRYIKCNAGESSLLSIEAALTMPIADVEFEISETSFGPVSVVIYVALEFKPALAQ